MDGKIISNEYVCNFVSNMDYSIDFLIKHDEKFYSCIKALIMLLSLKAECKESHDLLEEAYKLINGICDIAQNRLEEFQKKIN